jgi:hypothetical protein
MDFFKTYLPMKNQIHSFYLFKLKTIIESMADKNFEEEKRREERKNLVD